MINDQFVGSKQEKNIWLNCKILAAQAYPENEMKQY